MEEKGSAGSGFQDAVHRLAVQDDVEPDSLSEASKSDDGSIIEQRRQPQSERLEPQAKSSSFYIGSDEAAPKLEASASKSDTPKAEKKHKTFSTATLTKPRGHQNSGKVRPSVSAPLLGEGSPESREGSAAQLIRQESFTKERPSSTRLPNITSLPVQRDLESFQGVCSQDTHSYLKDTEDVLAALEAKLQAGRSGTSPAADSLSGESDVDTSSSVSQQSGNTKAEALAGKPPVISHRKKPSAGVVAPDRGRTAVEKAESVKRGAGLRRSVGKRGSTDLSDEPQGFPYSDQESSGTRKYTIPLQKEDGRSSRASQALTRTNSLSAPRPTRASMLRRARLGEASDNEGAETEGAPPPPQEAKKLSRLDMLAMPRKRTSSFNTTSDTEASSSSAAQQWTGRSTGFSNRSTEFGGNSARRASASGPKPVERPQKATLSRTPVTRARSGSAKYANSTASE